MAEKTNVCRILDQKKAAYTLHEYTSSSAVSGIEVAAEAGGAGLADLISAGPEGAAHFMIGRGAADDLGTGQA
ncbi:MAG: hypothetical protein IJO48_03820, partial [Clostridia bacterium]|nr:hypothetical protein [Clostridia bacterium]